MKRLFAALFAVVLLLPSASSAQDAAWQLNLLHAELDVRPDGSLHVQESITADFLTERHGIYRYLPVEGRDDKGKKYRLDVTLEEVTRDGEPERVDASTKDGRIVWRIGDPDVTMTGEHEYSLTYVVNGAVRGFEGFDEISWNVSGDGWDVPLPYVSATVALPPDVHALQQACYTGADGSTSSTCTVSGTSNVLGFVTDEEGLPMTVSVGFPKGAVAAAPAEAAAPWTKRAAPFAAALLPILTFVVLHRRWRRHGADASFGSVVTQYEGPAGLRPAEASALLRQSVASNALPVALVDLAVRGYLRFEEVQKGGLLGSAVGRTRDHYLHLIKPYRGDAEVRPYEAALLDALFGANAVVPTQTSVSGLHGKFHKPSAAFRKGLMDHLVAEGHFVGNPVTTRTLHLVAGFLLFVLSIFLLRTPWGWAIAVSGVLVVIFGFVMGKWSDKGREAAAHAQGHRAFIAAVEKHRAPWMETQDMFSKTLPYAMAFGLGARWAQAFAPLQLPPPDWYRDAAMAGAWSPVTFEKGLAGWSAAMIATSATPSGASGSGGGGFSGGGFGGGGGGSW